MLSRILNYIKSEEDNSPEFIRLTRNLLIFVMVTNTAVLPLVAGAINEDARNLFSLSVLLIALVIEAISLVFVFQGNVLLAKLVVPVGLVLAIGVIAFNANGIRDTSFIAMPIILIISAVLLGRRSLFITTPLIVLVAIVIAARDLTVVIDPGPIGIDDAIIITLLLIATASITQLLISRLNESILRAQKSEQAQRLENAELVLLQTSLEERVQERTAELEKANLSVERRARQFQAIAKVMNAISTTQSLELLLPLITRVISEQFNVYHTGIFLLDDNREYAVLRAANSEGGKRMLERRHQLAVGQSGIVGFVTATGQPRIALDVGADSVYFDNPDLPNTRSEIALPLRYSGQIIGALDVQSVEPNAFNSEDADVLTTLADQVAVAINNALSIEEAQKTLLEAQSAIGQTTQEAWQILRPAQLGLGFAYSESGVKPIQQPIENPQIHAAINRGETVLETGPDQKSRLVVPIRLRGKVIGVMHLNTTQGNYKLTEDDADIAEAVAERLSLAIETATLLQSTQHRADLERITTNITSKISSSARFETILQTAAQELSRVLGGSDVIVQIEPDALKMYS